jgi:transcriptional regulator with PAS, ATPase and Fis domain
VKGSFTGAYRDKPGKLETAHMGTIFLDEVGEMTLRMQGLLLRFLETGELQKVGADGSGRIVNVRVIAATNRNLRDMITQGIVPRRPVLPPQRDSHRGAAPARAPRRHSAAGAAVPDPVRAANRSPLSSITPAGHEGALRVLVAGNVRELENVIERLVVTVQSRRSSSITSHPKSACRATWPSGRAASAGARWPTSCTSA